MTENQQKLIDELVNKGLDGDMDAVNAHQDRMVRAKAKSMIMKIQKGILKSMYISLNSSNLFSDRARKVSSKK